MRFDDDYTEHGSANVKYRSSATTGAGSEPRPDTDGMGRGNAVPHVPGSDPGRVAWPPFGLTVRQLADRQREFATYARWRLYGVGADQYDEGGHQKCEDMDLPRLLLEARDELADLVNYLAFIDMRLDRMMKAVSQ